MLDLEAKETRELQQIRLADPTKLSSSSYQPEGTREGNMQAYEPKTAEKQHVLQFVSTFGQCYQHRLIKERILY